MSFLYIIVFTFFRKPKEKHVVKSLINSGKPQFAFIKDLHLKLILFLKLNTSVKKSINLIEVLF